MNPIILFDGICNFCNGSVNFVIKKDNEKKFHFAALQSEKGLELLKKFHLSPIQPDTFILIEDEKVFSKSTAGLKVLKGIGGIWSLLYVFIIIPSFIRDIIYDVIARNRYQWFGKKDSCMVPTQEVRDRFL